MKGCFLAILLSLIFLDTKAQEYSLSSPDGNIKVEIVVSANTIYRVYQGNKLLLHGKPIGLTVGKKNRLGYKEYSPSSANTSVDQTVKPVVPYRSAEIRENYRSLELNFESGLEIEFRCYNEGFAYRLGTTFEREVTVKREHLGFELTADPTVWFPKEKSFYSHNERRFVPTSNMELKTREKASLPVLWKWENGPFLLFTETDVRDYPGMYLETDGDGSYRGIHPKYPATTAKLFDRFEPVVFTKPFIARTDGKRKYPWRVFCISKDEQELMGTHLPWLLAAETRSDMTGWIKPGKVAWDWWNALQLDGVDFKPGLNTQTYKYYIDFAADNGLEYVILDEGWYKLGDLTKVKSTIDMPELINYANNKGVGVILWVVWRTLEKQFQQAFQQFSDWGIAGIKMDFMMRNDQPMIAFYEQVAKEAADRMMLVDFHGSHCPKGLQRTYPNVLTFEGVRGSEWNKWSRELTVDHDVTLPFTRMLTGPMDYTPGAMENISKPKLHRVNYKHPKSQGTRCHELAKYVIFESPLQMLADEPTAYEKERECLNFLKEVPTVWDETVVLEAKVADHIVLARRKGQTWFIGAMTGSTPQTFELDLSFLPAGTYGMEVWRDGDNVVEDGTDFEYYVEPSVSATMKYVVSLAEGGGWVAIIRDGVNKD